MNALTMDACEYVEACEKWLAECEENFELRRTQVENFGGGSGSYYVKKLTEASTRLRKAEVLLKDAWADLEDEL